MNFVEMSGDACGVKKDGLAIAHRTLDANVIGMLLEDVVNKVFLGEKVDAAVVAFKPDGIGNSILFFMSLMIYSLVNS